jgi:hypothetical protein
MRRFVWSVAEYLEASRPVKAPTSTLFNFPMTDTGNFEPADFFDLAKMGIIIRELGQQDCLRPGIFSELLYELADVRDKPAVLVLAIMFYHH